MENKDYKAHYKEAIENYKNMMKEYETAISSPRYLEVISDMPFQFLGAKHLCETLMLFENLDTKPKMTFASLYEAIGFYKELVSFNKKTDKLLEDASFISQIGALARYINNYANTNPYLGKSFCIASNTEIIKLADECLTNIPKYPDMLTKRFRWNFIESVISCFSKEELKQLVDEKIIRKNDIDNIELVNVKNDYKEKITYLCDLLGHGQPVMHSYELKLKGVSFPNEDGSSRQKNLEDLKEYMKANPNSEVSLTTRTYTYVPEIGEPEPAIEIAWDGKVIGNIARVAAEEVIQKFNNPQLTATCKEVTGEHKEGKDIYFGCVIHLNVIAPGYANIQTPQMNEDIEK